MVRYSDDHDYHEVRRWVLKNCKGRWYHRIVWMDSGSKNCMFEFNDERDAVLFTLRWA